MAGAVLSQIIISKILSSNSSNLSSFSPISSAVTSKETSYQAARSVVKFLLGTIIIQLGVVIWWWKRLHQSESERENDDHIGLEYGLVAREIEGEEGEVHEAEMKDAVGGTTSDGLRRGSKSIAETRRGVWALRICLTLVALAWLDEDEVRFKLGS